MFDAIAGYTKGAAYAVGDERLRGTIAPGKLADMVILGDDLMAAPEDRIMGLEVRGVMIGGKLALADGSF